MAKKKRKCLSCSDQFMSAGSYNRICGKCKRHRRIYSQGQGFYPVIGAHSSILNEATTQGILS